MKYRPEVDGLRAVAVVPVVLFHAGLPGVSGGFVGVDVFFVISGFLITSILLNDLETGRFSLVRFYERRARRILPALFFVILCCLPFAWAWMLPHELVAFGKSIAATALFSSNILFWREVDYFAAAGELKPLLHTWSLAVEEQYYLFFPIALALLWRWRRAAILPGLLLGVLASLAMATYGAQYHPSANFYLLPSRIWELLIGALVAAIGEATLARVRGWHAGLLGLLGLAMIVTAVAAFDEQTPNPGLATLLPVLGAALVLAFARADNGAGRLLSLKPLIGLGLVSYSLYLWHQPLLAFARIRDVAGPEGPLLWALLIATFVLAWLTWRFVEQPFRSSSPWLPQGWQVGAASLASIVLAVGIGSALIGGGGFGSRIAPAGFAFDDVGDIPAMLAPNYGLHRDCDAGVFTLSPNCRTSDAPVLALWGDSYAMHLASAMKSSPSSIPFIQLTLSSCGPFPGLAVKRRGHIIETCISFNDAALRWILSHDSVKTVVISSPFNQAEGPLSTADGRMFSSVEERRSALVKRIADLRRELAAAGKRLVIVSQPPTTGLDLGLCHIRTRLAGATDGSCDFAVRKYRANSASSIELVHALESVAPVIWLDRYICTEELCHVTMDGVLVYRDAGHMTGEGSRRLGLSVDLAGVVRAVAGENTDLPAAPGGGVVEGPAPLSTGDVP